MYDICKSGADSLILSKVMHLYTVETKQRYYLCYMLKPNFRGNTLRCF